MANYWGYRSGRFQRLCGQRRPQKSCTFPVRNNRCVGWNSKSRSLITTPRLWKVSLACSHPRSVFISATKYVPLSDPQNHSTCPHIHLKRIWYIVINFSTICVLRNDCIRCTFHIFVTHQIHDCVPFFSVVKSLLANHSVLLISKPPCLPDLVPAAFFYSQKSELPTKNRKPMTSGTK